MRLTSEFFVSAYIRRCHIEGAFATLRRRGAAEAGAVFVLIDRLDGTGALYGPASQTSYADANLDRAFTRLHIGESVPNAVIEDRLDKELRFDPDCWIIEVEERGGRHFLERVF